MAVIQNRSFIQEVLGYYEQEAGGDSHKVGLMPDSGRYASLPDTLRHEVRLEQARRGPQHSWQRVWLVMYAPSYQL